MDEGEKAGQFPLRSPDELLGGFLLASVEASLDGDDLGPVAVDRRPDPREVLFPLGERAVPEHGRVFVGGDFGSAAFCPGRVAEVLLLDGERHRAGLVETTLKPDLFAKVADDEYELSWFIEIDCGTESQPTIQRKCHAYADYRRTGTEQERHGIFPLVLWIAPDERRQTQLEQAIDGDRRIDPDLFVVTTSNQAAEVITDTDRQP